MNKKNNILRNELLEKNYENSTFRVNNKIEKTNEKLKNELIVVLYTFFRENQNYIYEVENRTDVLLLLENRIKKIIIKYYKYDLDIMKKELKNTFRVVYEFEFDILNLNDLSKPLLLNKDIYNIMNEKHYNYTINERMINNVNINTNDTIKKLNKDLINNVNISLLIQGLVESVATKRSYTVKSLLTTNMSLIIEKAQVRAYNDYEERLEELKEKKGVYKELIDGEEQELITEWKEEELIDDIEFIKEKVEKKGEKLTIKKLNKLIPLAYFNFKYNKKENNIKINKGDVEDNTVYIYNATLDDATCEECSSYDGMEASTRSDLPEIPQHTNCRCYIDTIKQSKITKQKFINL